MEIISQFSDVEKKTVERSWKVLDKNLKTTASNIFEMIFNQSPDTKALFPFMRITQGGRPKEMEFHALRFMQVLESVVKAIDNPEALNPLCDNLGRVHGRLSESRGFKTHHWGVFIECTLFHFRRVLGQDSYFSKMEILDRAIICWRTILRVLIKQMKEGFNTDIKNRAASREIDDNNKPSTSSTPDSEDYLDISAPATMTQSVTMPVINNNYKDGFETVRAQNNRGFFRPLKEFARRKFIPHF